MRLLIVAYDCQTFAWLRNGIEERLQSRFSELQTNWADASDAKCSCLKIGDNEWDWCVLDFSPTGANCHHFAVMLSKPALKLGRILAYRVETPTRGTIVRHLGEDCKTGDLVGTLAAIISGRQAFLRVL